MSVDIQLKCPLPSVGSSDCFLHISLPRPLSLSPPTLEHCGSTSTCRPDVPRGTQGLLQFVLFLLLAALQAVCLKQIYQEKDESPAQSQAHGGSVIFDVTKHKPPTSGGRTDQGAIFLALLV